MTQHDFKFRLQHMPDNAKEALSLIENKKRDDLQHERMLEICTSKQRKALDVNVEPSLFTKCTTVQAYGKL